MTVQNLVSRTIAPLIEALEGIAKIEMSTLRGLLKTLDISQEWVEKMTQGHQVGDDYHRLLLHSGANYEVVMAIWPVGTATLVHDHGSVDSFGMVRLLKGSFFNHLYHEIEGTLEPGERQFARSGELVDVPLGLVHQMGNASDQTYAASLHVYTPAIVEVSYWDPESLQRRNL